MRKLTSRDHQEFPFKASMILLSQPLYAASVPSFYAIRQSDADCSSNKAGAHPIDVFLTVDFAEFKATAQRVLIEVL
jgi:hypothetical protein